jgi:hypothetical protein
VRIWFVGLKRVEVVVVVVCHERVEFRTVSGVFMLDGSFVHLNFVVLIPAVNSKLSSHLPRISILSTQ